MPDNNNKPPVFSASLESVIERGQDYPLAYLAALQLREPMEQLAALFKEMPGKHAGALDQRQFKGITPDVMHTVKLATSQLQEHLFDLRKLAIDHPEQKEDIQAQIEETKLVSGALVEAVSMITRFNDVAQGNQHPVAKASAGGSGKGRE